MNLNITTEEAALLTSILKNALGDLKMESRKTENYDWRVALKQDEATLLDIINRPEVGARVQTPS